MRDFLKNIVWELNKISAKMLFRKKGIFLRVVSCLIISSIALEVKQYKRNAIKSHRIIDELTLPKTLIECCNGCMLFSEKCKGIIFDGTKCTRLCHFELIEDRESTDDQDMNAWIDDSLFQSKIIWLKS